MAAKKPAKRGRPPKPKPKPAPKPKSKDLGGRPRFIPTDEQRAYVRMLLTMGVRHDQIFPVVGISENTFGKAFRVEIDRARLDVGAQLMNAALYLALGHKPKGTTTYSREPDKTMLIFLLKTLAGMKEPGPGMPPMSPPAGSTPPATGAAGATVDPFGHITREDTVIVPLQPDEPIPAKPIL